MRHRIFRVQCARTVETSLHQPFILAFRTCRSATPSGAYGTPRSSPCRDTYRHRNSAPIWAFLGLASLAIP